jgi:hypothetical protein
MSDGHIDPAEVPEADLLEQRRPLEAEGLTDADLQPAPVTAVGPDELADQADVLEQQAVVPDGGEDDYPHD